MSPVRDPPSETEGPRPADGRLSEPEDARQTEGGPPAPESAPRSRWQAALPIAAPVLLGLVLRLIWVLTVPTKPVGDFAMYIESAEYLVEHGTFDPGFIYMPGYVLVLAGLYALGGGLLAFKLAGVLFGTLAVAAAAGIAGALIGRRAAVAAGLLAALWPSGVALASVCGTDMPAAALIAAAVWALCAWAPHRPRRAAVAFGLVMGLAASVRAVAAPLAVLSMFLWLARGAGLRRAALRAGLSVALAFLVLAPWAVRNRLRDGEWVLTDSHGGITALVGAFPNTEGRWTRSLNTLFVRVSGLPVLDGPHRQADRAAYAIAARWNRFEPTFALGLVTLKAERLLGPERGLLYWPLYRAGVLRGAWQAAFAERRAALEAAADLFWWGVVGAAAAGLALALLRRRLDVAWLVLPQAALCAIYAWFFAEPRYRLPVEILAFPLAAAGVAWGVEALGAALVGPRRAGLPRVVVAVAAVVAVLGGGPAIAAWGEGVRARHRWAVALYQQDGAERMALWRRADSPRGPSPVRGALDAVGLVPAVEAGPGTATASATTAAAQTALELPPGRWRLRAAIEDLSPAGGAGCVVDVRAAGRSLARAAPPPVVPLPGTGLAASGADPLRVADSERRAATPVADLVDHPGGPLELAFTARPADGASRCGPVWLSGLTLASEPGAYSPP